MGSDLRLELLELLERHVVVHKLARLTRAPIVVVVHLVVLRGIAMAVAVVVALVPWWSCCCCGATVSVQTSLMNA